MPVVRVAAFEMPFSCLVAAFDQKQDAFIKKKKKWKKKKNKAK